MAEPLSEAEIEILKMAAVGLRHKEMAERRCVSINAIKTQRKSALGKLGAKTMAHAVAIYLKEGSDQ